MIGPTLKSRAGMCVEKVESCILCGSAGRVLYENFSDRQFGVPGTRSRSGHLKFEGALFAAVEEATKLFSIDLGEEILLIASKEG